MKRRVLFVCLGNICRSPLAEAVFRLEAERAGLDVDVDSAGTGGWHVGEPPDWRAQALAKRHGLDVGDLRARQVSPEDFRRFDLILAMDRQNFAELHRMRPDAGHAELTLLLDHVPGREGQSVADPYYGGEAHFDVTWADVSAGARALANKLAEVP
ncbi:MAG TPA: low molecular weight protein-tyrosine-phosphatase [Allosphingosinicella sp.]|jgi:protein-tyrosine phosphatase|nr:low molecular weight protein-tyrosine-phosphatase [Allosphingosinicella sp.]